MDFGDGSWLPMLEKLHLQDNRIDSLQPLLHSPMLIHLDLSFNNIHDIEDLKFLAACPHLETLQLNDNPVAEHPQYRQQILVHVPTLKMLDGDPIEEAEREAAFEEVVRDNLMLPFRGLDLGNASFCAQGHQILESVMMDLPNSGALCRFPEEAAQQKDSLTHVGLNMKA